MSAATPSSQLLLPGIRCAAWIGHSDAEAAQPQGIIVALALTSDARSIAADTDNLADTVDYAQLTQLVVTVSASRRFHLLESLAHTLREALLPLLGPGIRLWVEVAKAESPIPILQPGASFAIGSPPLPSLLAHRPAGHRACDTMFHHVGLRSERPDRLIAFYEAALKPLGYRKLASYDSGAGFGRGEGTLFWLDGTSLWIGKASRSSSVHLAFSCRDRATVDAFFVEALRAGGNDNGTPGLRPGYDEGYYAGFIIDPDGNNIEAVCCGRPKE
jgi:FolB domain-containing protein